MQPSQKEWPEWVLQLENPFQQPAMAVHREQIHATFRCGEFGALKDYGLKLHDRSCLQGYLRVTALRESIGELNYAQLVLLEAPKKADLSQACANVP